MTVKSSGSLAFSEIQTEFTGSNPISLSEYYANGAYVPAGTSGINGAIPSSGAISVSKFYGSTKFTAVTHTYTSGSANETVPAGAQSVTITVVGAGGGGGTSYTDFGSDIYNSAGGGGGAGYSTITRAVASGDWNTTIAYSVAPSSGYSSTTNGSLAAGAVSLTGGGGSNGSGADANNAGAGGNGGTASGGSTNISGSAGGNGTQSGSSGNPGGAGGASGGTAYGYGGDGDSAPSVGTTAGGGVIIFAWT